MLCEYTSDGRSLNLVFRWVADADAHEVNQAALALTPTPNRTWAEISTSTHLHERAQLLYCDQDQSVRLGKRSIKPSVSSAPAAQVSFARDGRRSRRITVTYAGSKGACLVVCDRKEVCRNGVYSVNTEQLQRRPTLLRPYSHCEVQHPTKPIVQASR